MKKIDLTRETTTLQLSINELSTIKKVLIEVYHHFRWHGIRTKVFISITEVLSLAKKLKKIIDIMPSEEMEIQFTYREILTLQGSLNQICNSPDNLLEKIDAKKEQILPFVEFLSVEVIDKMESGTMLGLIGKKREQIFHKLSLNFSQVKLPITQLPLTQECYLKVESRLFMFLLSSLENSETWSNIQILEIDSQENNQVIDQSVIHKIDPYPLSEIAAYLEVCKDLVSQNIQPEIFILSPLSDKHNNICRFQVVSGKIDSEKRGFLEIRFSLNVEYRKDKPIEYREAQGLCSFGEIEEFTSSIYDFLVKISQS
jgi:hypothetical protein